MQLKSVSLFNQKYYDTPIAFSKGTEALSFSKGTKGGIRHSIYLG